MNRDTPLQHALHTRHPDYARKAQKWRQYKLLYDGGVNFEDAATEFLERRRQEPPDLYAERISRVYYENYLGSCIDWYVATLFRKPPTILVTATEPAVEDFYRNFLSDCDNCGMSLVEFARRQFAEALVYGETNVLVDFPRTEFEPRSKAEEEAVGRSRAYLVAQPPLQVTNWRKDSQGRWDWVVLSTADEFQDTYRATTRKTVQRWLVLNRESYATYELTENGPPTSKESRDPALVASGRHALATAQSVPLITWNLADGLWLANRAAGLQIEHFNKSNALAWALHLGLYAMPVVYSERDWNQMVGESYYIQLGPNDKFGWTEPEGKVFEIAAQNLERLKNEIYRVCYLLNQSGGLQPARFAQSGLSKSLDLVVTWEVLRAYATATKSYLRRILTAVALARGDDVAITISGLDQFGDADIDSEIATAKAIESLGVASEKLRIEIRKRIVAQYLADSDPAILAAILGEIAEG